MPYVVCKFRPEDARGYTYFYEGDDLVCGDEVKVPDRRGDGWQRVYVVDITDEAPSFPCKKILGKLEPEAPGDAGASDIDEDDLPF